VHFFEAVIAKDDVEIFIRIDERTRPVAERLPQLGLLLRQILFSPPLLRDVRHHRDGAATRDATTDDAIPPAVRGMVLKAPGVRIAQTVDALGDEGVDVTLTVEPCSAR